MVYQPKNANIKYAVKVPFDGEMLYVTQGGNMAHIRARLFDNEQQAKEHAILWGEQAIVVEYIDESDIL